MPLTYDPIATGTFSGSNYITFSSIPSTYTDLRVVISITSVSNANNIWLQFNGDFTGTSYSMVCARGTGSAASSQGTDGAGENNMRPYNLEIPNGTVGFATFDIFSYAGSTTKAVLITGSADANGSGNVNLTAARWANTAAITSIRCVNSNGTNGTATLYGIKAA
jgi:hypothetical protein